MPRAVAARADVLPVLAEVFREHGYEGASLSLLSERTGLGKGSLYHFFPGGKEEMAAAVLQEIDSWFAREVFTPLKESPGARQAVEQMFRSVITYFDSGRRVCLVGSFALGDSRDRFASAVREYFVAWKDALAGALRRLGHDAPAARELAEEGVAGIQGALVLSRALNDPASFRRGLERLKGRMLSVPTSRRRGS